MNTNSAFTGSYTGKLSWYQRINFIPIGILRAVQLIDHFDAVDKCRLNFTTIEAMNFQDDCPSISIDSVKDRYVLVFDLTSIHYATEKCHYPQLVGEPPRLGVNFTFPPRIRNSTHCIERTKRFRCS